MTLSPPKPLRIFLVEDHPDTLKWLVAHLTQLGHSVSSARTCAEAAQALKRATCDVLITDIGLPDGNGWDLLERLGAQRPPVAIAMSGFGTISDLERSRGAGFTHHLVKPFDPSKLEKLLVEAEATANLP